MGDGLVGLEGKHQDVANQHPEVVAELQAEIDRWYADVTKDSSPRVPIPIGYEVDPVIDLKVVRRFICQVTVPDTPH